MKSSTPLLGCLVLSLALAVPAMAQKSKPVSKVLITQANIFDGIHEKLAEGMSVLVDGNKITKIAKSIQPPEGATVIDAKGKTLIPGLIDVHWHTEYAYISQNAILTGDISEFAIRGALGSEKTLMRGFTTVRDVGGNVFTIKKMIDAGEIPGPRILPSGPGISQTGGHWDFRSVQAVPSNSADVLDYWNRNGLILLADGVPEVTKRTREVLRMGQP